MKTVRTFLYIQNNVWVNKIIVRSVRTNAPKECWFISLAILWTISVQRKEQFTSKCAQFCMCISVSVSVEYREFTIESSVLRIVCRTISLSPTGIRILGPCHTLSPSLFTGIRVLYPCRTVLPSLSTIAHVAPLWTIYCILSIWISPVLLSTANRRNSKFGHLRTDDSTWPVRRIESQYCATRTDNHAAIERDGDTVRQG